ncbi:MAG: sensor histidine kinase, partial [Acidimicrobiales bacterium]
RNVRLNAELMARLDELRSSRQRLVAAQDEERRRLERNLHDGAQQQLVALKVMVGLVERMAEDGEPVAELLAEVTKAAGEALENLRDLARGIYPPLLAAEGLPAALRAQAAKVPFAVEVEVDGVDRYPQDIEAAVYFCCLEALQNVSKYAGASQVTVTLQDGDGELAFSVADDGKGFDTTTTTYGSGCQNMADRVDALGGSLLMASEVGRGTTVSGSVPCPPLPATAVTAPR